MLELIDNEKVINDAFKHLSNDKVMEFFINSFGDKINPNDRYNSNYAISICNLIIEQQISFKAAISIKKKFFNLIDGKSNSEILKIPNDKIQSIGLSFRKVEYIKNVLIFFRDNKININEMSNDEITKSLISIKGIGKWTCEMFLMFVCLRKDIFSFGDLALVNSMKKNYCIDDLNSLKSISEKWKPYRTIAAILLWYSIENNIYFQPNSSL
ncbi:MAG: DNA-3-methyladenine glycosylase [Flavobacteriaceae bacterium]|nr:DNA-3-methyladenine glycosylase [Flavobacteriaceae bacterium]